MSRIVNEASNRFAVFEALREQIEHRALWLYLLVDEAEKKGLPADEFVPSAIRRCGLFQGAELAAKSKTEGLKGFGETLFTRTTLGIFEGEIDTCTDDELSVSYHYCPLVKAWQKQGCSDEDIARLCELAMCGDQGMAQACDCSLVLRKTIANGDDKCEIHYLKTKEQHCD